MVEQNSSSLSKLQCMYAHMIDANLFKTHFYIKKKVGRRPPPYLIP